ncbi:catalase family protein [Sedimenticola selenatireducens]|uniref:catalase family protein n=1 Tax=Sedimenticola selenatireducens TaxID=191960 RepID=UPI003F4AAD29
MNKALRRRLYPVLDVLHRLLVAGLNIERRLEPYFRPTLNRLTREPVARLLQYLINRNRPDYGLGLAEEKIFPWEEQALDDIIDLMADQMRGHFKPGGYERGGNTKTHGIVRATVTIRDDLPEHLRQGIFASQRSYPAYVRFSGPGPDVPADIRDVGFSSMAIKIMDVPGEKLMDEEKFTQDMMGVCTPTFVTPDVRENAKLQYWSLVDMPIYYFINPFDSHILDFIMQALWNETQFNPLGHRYYSCVPYLLGEGQAMMYSFAPKAAVPKDIPGLPFGSPPFNYLRDNMVKTLDEKDVEFDLQIQLQTDPHRMPIENAAVRWPEKLSPYIPAATIHIPRQKFDSAAQFEFAKRLKINPWHCIPEHRPLGNQSRARRRMYYELSKFRQEMNDVSHLEPTGDEVFADPE